MSIITCPKCGNTDVSWLCNEVDCTRYICLECKQVFYYTPKCDFYHDTPQTIFHSITRSLKGLAPKLVYFDGTVCDDNGMGYPWCSTILEGEYYETEKKAIAATIEKLKEAKND